MLQIKNTHHFDLPRISLRAPQPMQLSPVISSDDELDSAIIADPDAHDNNWELTDHVDGGELESFWATVENDISRDPTWFSFED